MAPGKVLSLLVALAVSVGAEVDDFTATVLANSMLQEYTKLSKDPQAQPKRAETYVTMSGPGYVRGTMLMWYSLVEAGATRPLLVLVVRDESPAGVEALAALHKFEEAFASSVRVRVVEGIANPASVKEKLRNIYTKLSIYNMTEFDRVVFVDSDIIFRKNIDDLFQVPCEGVFAAAPDLGYKAPEAWPVFLNTGLVVAAPNASLFADMMNKTPILEPPDKSDQGFLNLYFENKQLVLPSFYNVLRRTEHAFPAYFLDERATGVHYVGGKPWDANGRRAYSREYPQSYEEYDEVAKKFAAAHPDLATF